VSVTVLTVIHDSADHLRRLLASLDTRDHQLIVVDTGSSDDGAAVARAAGAEIVDLPHNPGFGAANNAGLEHASGEITALLNPDIVLTPGALDKLSRAAHERNALHVPRLLNPDGSPQDSVHPLPDARLNLLQAIAPGPLRRRLGEAAQGWAIAATMVARTTTLRALGPFDPDAFLFFEDLELCLRARRAGVPVELHRDIAVTHVGGHSTGSEDVALQVRRRREVLHAHLGARGARRADRALLLEHGLRAWRPRDRAYVRALRG
jgi:N-acetylglucosaminyl-diphospho-decaprenol L-rhamnosyltransferase